MTYWIRISTLFLGEFNSVQDSDINTGFIEADGNIANNNIFKDCYIEANGVIKYHKITDDVSDDPSESEESFNEENIKKISDKEVLNVNKLEFQKQLRRNELGFGDEVSFGIDKFVSKDIKEGNNKITKTTKFNKEMLYNELNGFFLKSYAVETKKLNDKIAAVSNFNDILLDLDVIDSMADEVLNDKSTTFESNEEKEYIEYIAKKYLYRGETFNVEINFNSLKGIKESMNFDLNPSYLDLCLINVLLKSDFFCSNLMPYAKNARAKSGNSLNYENTDMKEAMISDVQTKLLNIAKFFEHVEKLRIMTISETWRLIKDLVILEIYDIYSDISRAHCSRLDFSFIKL